MQAETAPHTTAFQARALIIALAVSLVLAYTTQSGALFAALDPKMFGGIPHLRSSLAALSDAAVMVVLTALAAQRGPGAIVALAGLGASPVRPLFWAVLIVAPAVFVCLLTTQPVPGLQAGDVFALAVVGPLIEEFVYRGLAVGVLVRLCGWHWLPACLWPAVFFGAVHAAQGSDLESIAGVVAITGLGGVLFGWLFVRWGYNLWPAVLLHIAMNALWLIFDLGEDAIGGWLGNGIRLAMVALSIAATLWLAPPQPQRSD